MVSCFKREGDIIKSNKKDKISYYVGWGIAYGTFVGGIFSVLLPEYLLVVFCLGIVFGAVLGVIFGKKNLVGRNLRFHIPNKQERAGQASKSQERRHPKRTGSCRIPSGRK